MPPIAALLQIAIIVAILYVCWIVAVKFSPDETVTKIIQVILFLIAIYVVITKLLPMVGIS